MAESIEDVRGGPRAISARWAVVFGITGARVLESGPAPWFEVDTGSETLLKGLFDGLEDFPSLRIQNVSMINT